MMTNVLQGHYPEILDVAIIYNALIVLKLSARYVFISFELLIYFIKKRRMIGFISDTSWLTNFIYLPAYVDSSKRLLLHF